MPALSVDSGADAHVPRHASDALDELTDRRTSPCLLHIQAAKVAFSA